MLLRAENNEQIWELEQKASDRRGSSMGKSFHFNLTTKREDDGRVSNAL